MHIKKKYYIYSYYKEEKVEEELIFEGELKDGKRWNGTGKEYHYQDKELIFEGEYKIGNKLN